MSKPASPLVTDVNEALATLRVFYDQVGQDPEVVSALVLAAGTIDVGGVTLTADGWHEIKAALALLENAPRTWQPSQLKPVLFAADGSPMFASEHFDSGGYWAPVAGITVTCAWSEYSIGFYTELYKELTQLLTNGRHYFILHGRNPGEVSPGFAATTRAGGAVTTLDQLRAMQREIEGMDP